MAWAHVQATRELALPPIPRLLMLVLALRANEDGVCWPSIPKLCADSGLARRTVQLHLRRFREQGLIARDVRPGRVACVRLLIGVHLSRAPLTPARSKSGMSATGPSDARQGRMTCALPAQHVHPPVQALRASGAPGAPEVKREYPLKIFTKIARTRANLVDKSLQPGTTGNQEWQKTETGITLKGVALGIAARPGETFGEYRDRLLAAERRRAGGSHVQKVDDVPHDR